MDERNNSHMDPWDRDIYETGSTNPPKQRGGIIAILLMLVIFLVGLSSVLGILNARLTSQQPADSRDDGPVIFHPTDHLDTTVPSSVEPSVPVTTPTTPKAPGLQLKPTPDSVENIPQEGGLSLQQIYSKAIDSVVSISCTGTTGTSTGTGVVLTENGYIVTNSHVVEDARSIQIRFTDDRLLPAALVGADAVSDLAVLYVQADDLSPAEFGDSSRLRVGDAVAAIGDPLGVEFRGTMTDGIVSAINREVSVGSRTMTLIQTNAAMNSGNSGGPLLNCYGQVIGINTLKIGAFSDSAGVEGLAFAIPSTTVKEIVDQIIDQGYVSGRPSIGIRCENVPEAYQRYYRLPAGAYITAVEEGSAAQKAGLLAGDILLSIQDIRITSVDELSSALLSMNAGDTVSIIIYRNQKQYSATITLDQAGA